ncbi:MAG TPA: hypothetical protein VFK02_30825 [Kofleriaceae bacterium]|nr:hypothetical protein [Kofleriaceae bacterium]
MAGDSPPIARLRARLTMQAAPPLAVSARPQQYVFDEDSAAYAEIDVRRGEDFALVVVIGSLPSEQFIVDVWHRFAREVWLVDTREEAVYVARAGAPPEVLGRIETLRSPALPGVAIPIDALFAPPS